MVHTVPTFLWVDKIHKRKSTQAGEGNTKSQKHHKMHKAPAQFAAGAMGGCSATYCTHWLDTVRVKMQTSPEAYRSSMWCLRETLRHNGVRGLYQGATPALVGHTVKAAVVFMSYGLCEETVRKLTNCKTVEELKLWQHASAGAMTGVLASFFLCPAEVVKCRQQTATILGVKRVPTPMEVTRNTLRAEGVRGMFRGLNGMWAKDIPGSFIYFGSYELSMSVLRDYEHRHYLGPVEKFASGTFAGFCFCITHPLESVKTRVQVTAVSAADTPGFLRSLCHILKTEGLMPLFSGIKPSMLRACLFSGIQFLTYETVKDFLLADQDHAA